MKRIVTKAILIIVPSVIFVFSLIVISVQAKVLSNSTFQEGYPPPLEITPNKSTLLNLSNVTYLPYIGKPWQYIQVTALPNSISTYIKTFAENSLYYAGCEQGTKDKNLPGTQNSIVFLHFGQPYQSGLQFGVRLLDTYEFKSTEDIKNEVIQYAKGYWTCTGADVQSHVTIAIGTSNNSPTYTTFEHGSAWGRAVIATDELLAQTYYDSQVSLAGASDMELGFNSPSATIDWVDGYNNVVLDPYYEVLFRLFSIGDAAGCPPYGNCGTSSYPDWTQEDVWYISYGCSSCYPLPMIYENNWAHATQWQSLSKYSKKEHGYKILFSGTTTQFSACEQRWFTDPQCEFLDNTPEEGYKQLYTTLNSDQDTAQDVNSLTWSTDMKWWGE